jgi:hypothetical protein
MKNLRHVLVVVVCCLNSVFPLHAQGDGCNQTYRDALNDFYNATGGDHWHNNSKWNDMAISCCLWYGVGCTSGSVGLRLASNNLVGTLPPSLKALGTQMQVIDISNNSISGSLPPTIAAWTLLISFNASHNRLSGSLPTDYEAWLRLTSFDVSANRINGSLPPSYSNWTSITYFSVYSNAIEGTIPVNYS